MKKISVLHILVLAVIALTHAQSVDDYRSAGSGSWTTATTWERFDGAMWLPAVVAPNSANGMITIHSPHIVSVSSVASGDQVIIETGGTLSVASNFILSNGTGNDITVHGSMHFNSGTLDGSGSIQIENTGTFQIATSSVKTTQAGVSIINDGTMSWEEGGINGSGAVINNNIFNITASALWQFSGGLTNTGTINKTAGTTTISTPWSNSGTINFSGGSLTSGAVFTNTGILTFSSGAAWQNNATFIHNPGSIISGTGSFSNAGFLNLQINLVFPATLVFSSTNTINGPGDLTINNDFTIQGNVTGGAMILNGNGDWQGGTFGRNLTIQPGNTLLLSTSAVKSLEAGVTITNNGTMTWGEGGINGSGAVINNNTFNITASALWQFSGGLTNTGTINKTAGTTTISTPWSNSGTINFSGGSLTSGAIFTNTGILTFSSGAAWQNNSTFVHNPGSIISGTGSFSNAGFLNLQINLIFPATLVFSSTNTISGPGDLTINNDFTIQGNITGGAMILNGNGDWQGGSFGRNLTIQPGNTLLLSTSAVKSLDAGVTITNNGTMTWAEGGINGSGAVINNNILNITASALWQFSGGLTNTGTINKTAGTTTISTPWSNSGTINFSGGSLTSGAIFTSTGILTFSSGAAWQNNSTFIHNPGSIISGTGSFSNAGFLNLQINLVFPATLVFSSTNTINGPGDLTINHDFTIQGNITGGAMILNGNGDWQGGSFGRDLTIQPGNTLLLSTSAVKTFNAGVTITNNGTMTWAEGGINASGAVINNNIFNITASALWQFSGGLTNNGTITKTSAGTTTLQTPVVNNASGTIKGTGTFSFNNLTNNGILAPGLSPGILTVNGAAPFSATSTFDIEVEDNTGPGTGHDQMQRAGNLILNGTLTVTETGTVPDGVYTIVTLTSGTISGNFTTTVLPPGYTVEVLPTEVHLLKNVQLPLTLVSFTGRITRENQVSLQWATSDEYNVSHFAIEHSTGGTAFELIGTIPALNLPAGHAYGFIHHTPSRDMNYYRLRMIDLDASFTYSPVIAVKTAAQEISVFPTIATDRVYVSVPDNTPVFLFTHSGVLLYETEPGEKGFIDISRLPAGIYLVSAGISTRAVPVIKL